MEAYYSREALALAEWALEENSNRVKASRIQRVAEQLEVRYRKHHSSEVDDPSRKPLSAWIVSAVYEKSMLTN